jgi:hypothetical protein
VLITAGRVRVTCTEITWPTSDDVMREQWAEENIGRFEGEELGFPRVLICSARLSAKDGDNNSLISR